MTLRQFGNENFEGLAHLWAQTLPNKYRVSAELLRQNTVDSGFMVDQASFCADDKGQVSGWVVVKNSGCGLYPGPEPTWFHINSLVFSDPEEGQQLLNAALKAMRELGATKVFYGQDLRHFWPGVCDGGEGIATLLEANGFSIGTRNIDLENDLATYTPPSNAFDKVGDASFRPCTPEDIPLLDEFLEREFPRRWRYEVNWKIEQEGTPSDVYGCFIDGKCEGFASTQRQGHKRPICGAVWNLDLGENWGALGPIGVSEQIRGRGLGGAMLASGLLGLKCHGVRKCIIDWTTLEEFYGKHGFKANRVYIPYTLEL
ncbi:MAG: hypothetical protein JST40_10630 [Armatimonadetes bacterium]|nr:hypothetical protein [Armatimonadota bacterium]